MQRMKVAVLMILICGSASVANAQDAPPKKFELAGTFSRDISSSPNIPISGAFNERESGDGMSRAFNGSTHRESSMFWTISV